MIFYITKYATTRGIFTIEGTTKPAYGEKTYAEDQNTEVHRRLYILGTDAFGTPEEAIANAKQRKEKEIETLKRKLEKLESLEFKIPQ